MSADEKGAGEKVRKERGSALEKALAVLSAVIDQPQAVGLPDVAARVGLPRQTVHRVLQQLEAETKRRLKPLVGALGGDENEDPAGAEKGIRLADKWADKDWSGMMETLAAMLPRYIQFFEKLEADARVEDRELLARVTAHERALDVFARRECAGQGATSLEPVIALLDTVPSR